jgi:hypothetical protein
MALTELDLNVGLGFRPDVPANLVRAGQPQCRRAPATGKPKRKPATTVNDLKHPKVTNRRSSTNRCSQPWVDGFGFQGEYGEDRFVDAPQRFGAGGAFQGFESEGVFAEGQGPLVAEAALA